MAGSYRSQLASNSWHKGRVPIEKCPHGGSSQSVAQANWVGEYVQRLVCFVNIRSSLHENIVFSVCVRMGNVAYIIFIMWNSISGLDAWYHFRLNISCGVAVTVRGHQKTQTCMQEYASAGKLLSMFELLNGCTFCKKLWAFSPLPPLSYMFKALH